MREYFCPECGQMTEGFGQWTTSPSPVHLENCPNTLPKVGNTSDK